MILVFFIVLWSEIWSEILSRDNPKTTESRIVHIKRINDSIPIDYDYSNKSFAVLKESSTEKYLIMCEIKGIRLKDGTSLEVLCTDSLFLFKDVLTIKGYIIEDTGIKATVNM